MPTAKKKAPTAKTAATSKPNSVLVKTSKINVFQVAILVLLFVTAGVVYKVYSNAGGCYGVTFKYGSQGRCVTDIQKLNNWQATKGLANTIAVDGQYGPATRSSIAKYQQKMGLGVDGIVGPKTWPVLCQWHYGPGGPPSSYPLAAARDAGCPGV